MIELTILVRLVLLTVLVVTISVKLRIKIGSSKWETGKRHPSGFLSQNTTKPTHCTQISAVGAGFSANA
jgi:hypothetical protein